MEHFQGMSRAAAGYLRPLYPSPKADILDRHEKRLLLTQSRNIWNGDIILPMIKVSELTISIFVASEVTEWPNHF